MNSINKNPEYGFDGIKKPPRHVAIIMDGNGRWAQKRMWNRIRGHSVGAESVDIITQAARKMGIEYLTLYAFSTENWGRPEEEVSGLIELLGQYLVKKRESLLKNKIRIAYIGQTWRFPPEIMGVMERLAEETEKNGYEMTLILALSYGSRQEMVACVKSIGESIKNGELSPSDIDEEMITARLSTSGIPDPDLIIRTGGEQRLSNFLLWQSVYAEFFFTDILWPDFTEKNFLDAVDIYLRRKRNFGKIVSL